MCPISEKVIIIYITYICYSFHAYIENKMPIIHCSYVDT